MYSTVTACTLVAVIAADMIVFTMNYNRGYVGKGRLKKWLQRKIGFGRYWMLVFGLMGFGLAASLALWDGIYNLFYWLPMLVIDVDELLTGGDDKWKKLKGWATNKVKWLMKLPPKPEPKAVPA